LDLSSFLSCFLKVAQNTCIVCAPAPHKNGTVVSASDLKLESWHEQISPRFREELTKFIIEQEQLLGSTQFNLGTFKNIQPADW
jgi:hypothetical protein